MDIYGDGFCCECGIGWATVTSGVVSGAFHNGASLWETYGNIGSRLDALFWVDEFCIAHQSTLEVTIGSPNGNKTNN